MESQNELFPAFIRLHGALVTVIGGGQIAFRKVNKLLSCGAKVRVVAPTLGHPMMSLYESGLIDWDARIFQEGDIAGARLVVAATNDRDVNGEISKRAQDLGIFVNTVDNPDLCTFMFPATARYGDVRIAISTLGHRPKLAKRLRQALEHDLEKNTNTFVPSLKHHDGSDPK